jgi:hypothetical protein
VIHLLRHALRGAACRKAVRLAGFFVLFAAPAGAQTLSGRVTSSGRPLPDAVVELHRVTQAERGVVRQVSTDASGRFSLPLPPPADTGFTVYFATAVAHGVRYFGPPLHGGEGAGDYLIEAYDTTSSTAAADSVTVVRRDVILSAGTEGGWEVAELVRLRNPTRRTLVPALDRPVVSVPLPAGVGAFEAGAGDQPADSSAAGELVPVGGRAWVRAPFVPGERDFVFRYVLPATPQRVALPLGRRTDSLTVYVRQPAPDAEVHGIPEGEQFSAEGERFRRYVGGGLAPDALVEIDWRGPRQSPVDPRWAALAVAALILAAGGWMALRRQA